MYYYRYLIIMLHISTILKLINKLYKTFIKLIE